MQIGIIGLNHTQAPLSLRDLFAKACLRLFGPGAHCAEGRATVLLSTCNRTELYFHSQDLSTTQSNLLALLKRELNEDFEQKLYSFFREDCFWHLCRVTAGLDSAIAAETEIQGQVKKAYERASDIVSLPSALHYLFQKALKTGKKIRHEFLQGHRMPELEHSLLQKGKEHFNNISSSKILFVGTSEINKKVIRLFQNKGLNDLTLCNRSDETALTLAKKNQIDAITWKELHQWQNWDWVILGTKSPHPLLTGANTSQGADHTLLMDLAVPCNASSELKDYDNITLYNIDELIQSLQGRREVLLSSLEKSEDLVREFASRYAARYQERIFALA